MEALILAGGKGTRLRPYTTVLPKPLMPVGEKPILEILIGQLKNAGVKKVTLAVNVNADLIRAFFAARSDLGIEIEFSQETKPLGTVAPLKLIDDLPDHFMVMNGDILTDLKFKDLYDNHVESGALLSIASYKREVKIDFGVLEIADNRLTGFKEKPQFDFNVSMGIYVFNKAVLDLVPKDEFFGFDSLVYKLLDEKKHVNIFPFSGYWLDIGRPDDFAKANEDVDKLKF